WRSFPPIGRHCHRRRLRDDVSALELLGVGVSIGVHGWRRLFLRQSDSERRFGEDRFAGLLPMSKELFLAASGYFHVTDLVYGFMAPVCDTVSAYQESGRATAPSTC